MSTFALHLGDCRDVLPTLDDASVDAVICDPPYPEISRPYGRMTEAEWHAMMCVVVPECRRVLKPTGSAVFILQPNSRKVGSMRLWLWEFVAWAGREWNLVQDVWWWNINALPLTKNDPNQLRPSVKACVWLGDPDCYRDISSVRWEVSDQKRAEVMARRADNGAKTWASRAHVNHQKIWAASVKNGGVQPHNLLPLGVHGGNNTAGRHGHAAGTPTDLADWWIRYLSRPDDVICDPFTGSGTVGLAALKLGRSFIGIEREPSYVEIARRRLATESAEPPLFAKAVAP